MGKQILFLRNFLLTIFRNYNLCSFWTIPAGICQIPKNSSRNYPDSAISPRGAKFCAKIYSEKSARACAKEILQFEGDKGKLDSFGQSQGEFIRFRKIPAVISLISQIPLRSANSAPKSILKNHQERAPKKSYDSGGIRGNLLGGNTGKGLQR